MGKELGSPKTGGRQKGTPNKATSDLIARLLENNLDPVQEIIEVYRAAAPNEKPSILLSLLPYILPKRKPAETPAHMNWREIVEESTLNELYEMQSEIQERIDALTPPKSDQEKESDLKFLINFLKLNADNISKDDKLDLITFLR